MPKSVCVIVVMPIPDFLFLKFCIIFQGKWEGRFVLREWNGVVKILSGILLLTEKAGCN